jgi:hypothetical protein
MGRPKETPRADACEKTLAAKVAVYEQILAKQRYLAGDELTLADLNHLPFGAFVTPHGYTWFTPGGEFPNLARYISPRMLRFCSDSKSAGGGLRSAPGHHGQRSSVSHASRPRCTTCALNRAPFEHGTPRIQNVKWAV